MKSEGTQTIKYQQVLCLNNNENKLSYDMDNKGIIVGFSCWRQEKGEELYL